MEVGSDGGLEIDYVTIHSFLLCCLCRWGMKETPFLGTVTTVPRSSSVGGGLNRLFVLVCGFGLGARGRRVPTGPVCTSVAPSPCGFSLLGAGSADGPDPPGWGGWGRGSQGFPRLARPHPE